MNYRPYLDIREFISDLFQSIDFARQILMFGQDQEIPDVKASRLKTILQKNLSYLLPANATQVNSEVVMNFTSFDPLYIGQFNDLFFLAVNVVSFTSKPITVFLFFEESGLAYTIPVLGNTFNPLTNRPFGCDDCDANVFKSLFNKEISEFKKTDADMEKMLGELKELLSIPTYSTVTKHSLDMNVAGILDFSKKHKKGI